MNEKLERAHPTATSHARATSWVLTRRATGGFVVAFALFIGAGIAGIREQRHVTDSRDWSMQTLQVIEQARSILRSLLDAETGQRGYLLTGSDGYLLPYHEAVRTLPDSVTKLEQVVAADPDQRQRLTPLRPLVTADLEELESTIVLRRHGSSEEALRQLWANADGGTMDQIRILLRDFQDNERSSQGARIEASVVRSRRARDFIALATLLGAALAAGSLVGMNKQARKRMLAEQEVARIEVVQRDAWAMIEERTRALAELQTAQRDAEAASRSKDEFLAILSHELRSPLNAILGWVTLLRRGALPDQQKIEHAMATIERNVHLQVQLVDDLLDVSRIVSGKLGVDEVPVDLSAVVHLAVENSRPAAEQKGVEIVASLAPRSRVVIGDEKRLQQVAGNLLTNAIKFTPRGGRVDVILSTHGREAVLRVADTGIGIAPEFLPYVFDRFRQAEGSTTRRHGGLGLGLSIVSTLTSLHHGRVEAASPGLGKGSVFTVRLPLRTTAVEPRAPSGHAAHDELRGMTILLVEDDVDAREALCLTLERSGARVLGCASTSEAMIALERAVPDLIVSDIGMPDEDGYQFMRRVRQRDDSHIAAIALTGFANEQDRQEAMRSGFDAHLSKPVSPDALIAKVRALVDERRYHAV